MQSLLNVIQIIVSIVLIIVVLLQAKGAGLGGILGGDSSVFRTRRGVEKLLFRFTIVLAVVFVVISIISVRATA